MLDSGLALNIITGLNTPIKKPRLSDWLKKATSYYILSIRDKPLEKDRNKLQGKDGKNTYQATYKHKTYVG